MTQYTDAFGGANIYPSELSYSAISLTSSLQLNWPAEASATADFVTKIMDVDSDSTSWSLILPNATEASLGETVLINNVGGSTFDVKDYGGTLIVSPATGTVWQLYLTDNGTTAGTWRALQYGAATASANAAALAGTGIVAVGSVLSQGMPITAFNNTYTAGSGDRARMFVWTGASGTLTLSAAASMGDNWFIAVRNSGTGTLTVDTADSSLVDGAASKTYQPGESSLVASDGTNYYTVGYGQSSTYAFDYTSIDVAGGGNYTLAGSELNRTAYSFTGLLTADRNVIVPSTIQQYWVSNDTTGAFTLRIKTALGAGITIAASERAIFYCDGSDVIDADTSTVSLPVQVNQGGTGAVNAGSALINLGGGSVGIATFQAATTSDAYSALGRPPGISGGTF